MTAIQILGLVLFIVAIAGVLGFLFQAGKDTEEQQPYIKPTYTKQELENIKLAEELYNKDLRPEVVAEELQVTEPEFVAKTKAVESFVDVEQVEVRPVAKKLSDMPVAPEFADKVVETAKVFPPEAVINAEVVVETKKEKSEFPIDKPKKKRKYHAKSKK